MKSFITRTVLILLVCCSCFTKNATAQVDTVIGAATPQGGGGSYQKMAHALCDPLSGDQQKANAIYNWITHNISYDVKALQQGKLKQEDPKKVFKQRKGMCSGYSLLFAAMCNEVGIKALYIDGYSKDWMFDDGDKLYIPRHAWNVVYIDQKWKLVDATWGAGVLTQAPGWLKRTMSKASKNPLQTSGKLKFRFQYDPVYFLSDPLAFRLKHLPTDPVWQLTESYMPLSVFEAGQIAIQKYNERFPNLAEHTSVHDSLSNMDETTRLQVSAERMCHYNPRLHVAMAAKYHADAMDTIAANAEHKFGGGTHALTTVQQGLKLAEQEVDQQKKGITDEYAALGTKNKTKNLQAKQYIQSLHSDNKRMIAQCESRIKRVNSLSAGINKKAASAAHSSKEINAGKLAEIATAQKQESPESATLQTLVDSVNNRKARITTLKQTIAQQQNKVKSEREVNGKRLDTLASIFVIADSALTEETINRLQMHDNYDEEVLQWNRLVKTVRLQQVDTMQKDYFTAYDSVNNYYETLRQNQWEQLELYRNNLKDMERYKRRNNNSSFLSQYNTTVQERETSMNAYYQALADHKVYVENHKGLFKNLIKLYKRQEELAGYMDKSEEKRKDLEAKNLTKKEDFDKKENKHQKEQLKQTGDIAEKELS